MKQSKINLKEGVTILAVEVPDEAFIDSYSGIIFLEKPNPNSRVIKSLYVPAIDEPLGRFTELSEEQCAELVDGIESDFYLSPLMSRLYQDYESVNGAFSSSWDSLASALEANGIDPNKALIIKVNQ